MEKGLMTLVMFSREHILYKTAASVMDTWGVSLTLFIRSFFNKWSQDPKNNE